MTIAPIAGMQHPFLDRLEVGTIGTLAGGAGFVGTTACGLVSCISIVRRGGGVVTAAMTAASAEDFKPSREL
jgi:hypothetical protein